jgi:spermidine synthase
VYEVVFLRMLGLVFGHTVHAVATVLIVFMGGLALGSALGGGLARRLRNPIQAYGWLELGIGAWAALIPTLFAWSAAWYPDLFRALGRSYAVLPWIQFAICSALLLLPTTLMGGTLPILSQALAGRESRVGRLVGGLYAANTCGAVVGAAMAGYALLPSLGNRATIEIAAALNLVLGVTAILYGRSRSAPSEQSDSATARGSDAGAEAPSLADVWPLGVRLTVIALGVSGAVSMLYEVTWTRALALMLGSSSQAFTAMLVAFLLGIAGGSALYAWRWGRRRPSPAAFGVLQAGIALLVVPVLLMFDRLPELLLAALNWSQTAAFVTWIQLGFSALALLPVTLLIGATFPCAVAVATQQAARVGEAVGWVYAANTVGAVAGAVLTGFVLVPAIGVHAAIVVGVAANLALAAVLFASADLRPAWRWGSVGAALLGGVAVLLLAPWDQRVMSSGPAIYGPRYLKSGGSGSVVDTLRTQRLLFYRDGRAATVSVGQSGPHRYLRINGKTEGSTSVDMPTQELVGHLPLLLHPDPHDVLVIGLGTGVTAGAAARHGIGRLDVVEIEPAVVEAAGRFFGEANGHVLLDPRTRTIIADGRNFLLTTSDRYDVIISEPSNPWISGVASLFSQEFFQLARERLRQGGTMVQWVQLYNLGADDLKMVLKTFQSVFPATTVWNVSEDLLLLGRTEPKPLDLARVKTRFATARVAQGLGYPGNGSWPSLLGFFTLGETDTVRFVERAGTNTDDRLPLEFSAPRALYLDTGRQNQEAMRRARTSPLPELAPGTRDELERAEASYWIGVACLGRNALEDALAHFQRALEVERDHKPALLESAGIYLKMGRPHDALAFAQRALDHGPLRAKTLYLVGRIYETLNLTDRAWQALEQALALEPGDARLRSDVLLALKRLGGEGRPTSR